LAIPISPPLAIKEDDKGLEPKEEPETPPPPPPEPPDLTLSPLQEEP
jgi:hypothetical protein